MANVKISALPAAATPLAGTETVPIVQSATTKQVAVSALLGASVLLAGSTSTGEQIAPDWYASGKTGATSSPGILAGGTTSGAPTTGAHVVGEVVVDATGILWICTVAGTPGTWVDASSSGRELAYAENITGTAVTVTGTGSSPGTLTDITGVSISVAPTLRPVYLEAACSGTQITNAVLGTGGIFIVETTGAATTLITRFTRLPGSITTRENVFTLKAKVRIGPVASTRTFKLQCRADSSTATAAIFTVPTIATLQPWLVALTA